MMVPAPERWLTLTLVVDTGPTMGLWRPLARELAETLVRQGAFRDVRVVFLARSGRVLSGGRALDPSTLLDPTGRHAILVLSDCSGPHWWDGRARRTVRRLASTGPVAILQPLPERLWRRTAAPTLPGLAALPRPAAPNRDLRFAPYDGEAPDGLPVPVLHAAPRWFAGWARLLAGGGPEATAVAVFPANPPAASPVRRERELPIGDRVRRFLTSASPEAAELAAHVAVSEPSLPVMRLIQRRILGASGPAQLAEVLLSGLLRPVAGEDGRYTFVPGARDALLATLPRPAEQHTRYVLRAISDEIKRRAGTAVERFPALLHSPGGTHTITTDDHEFAHVGPGTRAHLQPGAPRAETPAPFRCAVAVELLPPAARTGTAPFRRLVAESILLVASTMVGLPRPALLHDDENKVVAAYSADVRPRQIMDDLLPALRASVDAHNEHATEPVRLRVALHADALPLSSVNVRAPAFVRLDLLLRTLAHRESLIREGADVAVLASDELVSAIRAEAPDADPAAPFTRVSVADGVTAWFGSWGGGENTARTVIFTDVAGFSSPHRTEDDRYRILQVMSNLLRDAFNAANVPWNDCHIENRGDGFLIVAPPGVLADVLLAPMLPSLAESLRRHNERSAAPESFQMRVALSTGVVVPDEISLVGRAIIEAARMLDAPAFKRRMADSRADLAFITTEAVFEVLIEGSGRPLIPSRFTQVPVDVKDEHFAAWMRLWGGTDDERPAPVAAPVTLGRDDAGEPVVLDPLADRPHGLVLGGMDERGPVLRAIVAALPPEVDVVGLALGESPFAERENGLLRSASELLGDEVRRNTLIALMAGELDGRQGDVRSTPRLVIIVDLSLTLPPHLPELIRLLRQVASGGAAVGVHLILAATELENSSQWNSLLPLLSWRLAVGPITPRDSTKLFSRAVRLTPGTAYFFRANEPSRTLRLAVSDTDETTPPSEPAQAEQDTLRAHVDSIRVLMDEGDREQARRETLAALDISQRLRNGPPDVLDLREQLAALVVWLTPDHAFATHQELVADSERVLGEGHEDTRRRRSALRFVLIQKGKWAEARTVNEKQIETLRRGAQEDEELIPALALELDQHSPLLLALGEADGSLAAIDEAVELWRRFLDGRPDHDPSGLAQSLGNLSLALARDDRHAEALAAVDEAVTILRARADADPESVPSLVWHLQNLSDRHEESGHLDEAVAVMAEAVDYQRRLGEDDAENRAMLASLLVTYAQRLDAAGNARQALDTLTEALTSQKGVAPLLISGRLSGTALSIASRLSADGDDAPIEALRALVRPLRELFAERPDDFGRPLADLLEDLGGRLVDARRWAETLPVVEEAVRIRREQHGESPEDASARLASDLVLLGRVLIHVGRVEDAVDVSREAVRLFRDLDDGSGQARAVSGLGVALRALGRLEEAREHFRTAASIARDADDLDARIAALTDEARTFAMEQREDDAVSVLREAADVCREAEEPGRESALLNELGRMERVLHNPERAVTAHREAFYLAQRIGDREREAEFASELVRSLIENEGLTEAADVQRHAIDVHRTLGNLAGEADGWRQLGRIESDAGHLVAAVSAYAKAAACFRTAGNHEAAGEALNRLAEVRFARGDVEGSLDAAKDAVNVFRELSAVDPVRHGNGLARSLLWLARVLRELGRTSEATAATAEARAIGARLGGEAGSAGP
ncbi:tetratricopeptide repeat protein [Actinomadura rayongensis]|uniref:Tetratricopeptide repeat protein n=1 Tax=Actinomadura rayongensis TaxID=1429076 RepID=A0A6I4W744_9ACTN|nr:tetratricopeptide repeat protein [Actinomadura rayongensis]